MLSFWSSDEDDSDAEVDEEKEAERKRRELEREKILSMAGLKLRREPPSIPTTAKDGLAGNDSRPRLDRKPSRRRPAPAAPKKRRQAPAIPHPAKDDMVMPSDDEQPTRDPALETKDAYARYEQFLAESKDRPQTRPRSESRPVSQALSPTVSQTSLPAGAGGGKITGFFSRMMAPTASQDSTKRTTISGPITRVDSPVDPAPGQQDTSGIGKTWSSLVDPGVLASMSDQERKRQESIFEFIATEATYNRDLQLIVQVFYASLLDNGSTLGLEDKALTVIFANVEDILLANTSFYSSLEERQKNCRLYIDTIGDILQDNMPSMEVYTTYCVNQSQANRLLQSQRQSNPALQAHLQKIREDNDDTRGLDLASFLLIPMQRITRYPLLLKQIIHYTSSDQDVRPLKNALHTVEGIVATINESVREAEGLERLRLLSEELWVGGEG